MHDNRLLITMLLAWLVFGLGCADRAQKTVPGPESDKLIAATTGYIVMETSPDGITAIQLPSLKESTVRSAGPDPGKRPDTPTIHALSGPDAEGRIAYIEDHFFVSNKNQRRHLLKTIRLDGKQDTELFSRPGNAMWAESAAGKGEIGKQLALSPRRGQVAFLSGLKSVQMPSCLLSEGSIEVWDIDKKTGKKIGVRALDEGLAWFPDGKRLAYVKLVEPKAAWGANPEAGSFGKTFRGWEKVPAVFIRDVSAKTESLLHIGWRPIVSFDGRTVLVSDKENAWKQVDAATGKATDVRWRGIAWPGVIASPTKDVVLAWCLPTEGTKIKYTEHNSPLVGSKQMMTLKLALLNSDEFQTVVPYIDPRRVISFGEGRKNE